jgi:small subunit ribosomal protein S20
MAITSSAKKALRVSRRRRVFNKRRKDTFVELVKRIRKFVTDKKTAEAAALLGQAYKAIDKAVKTDLLKKNAAARKKSRLAKLIKRSK